MGLICTTDGLQFMLDKGRGGLVAAGGMSLRLFQNDYVPLKTSQLSDFVIATFPGYAAVLLDSWSTVALNAGQDAEINEVTRSFTMTAASPTNPIYGYLVVDPGSNKVLWAERAASAPFLMDAAGKTYGVRCKFTLRNFST